MVVSIKGAGSMNKRSKIQIISLFSIAIILFIIGFFLMSDISFLLVGIATILVGVALFILIYEYSHKKG